MNKKNITTKLARVRVTTSARKEKFEKTGENTFSISVREKPERNAANTRICALMARHFKVPAKAVRIVSGHHSRTKLISMVK